MMTMCWVIVLYFRYGVPAQLPLVYLPTYVPTHTRMAPWLIGVIFGYIMFHLKGKTVSIPRVRHKLKLLFWFQKNRFIVAVRFNRLDFIDTHHSRHLHGNLSQAPAIVSSKRKRDRTFIKRIANSNNLASVNVFHNICMHSRLWWPY